MQAELVTAVVFIVVLLLLAHMASAPAWLARQAEAATVTGHLARSNDLDGDGIPIRELDRSPVDDDPAGDLGRCVGHWRIRRPCGSKSGSGWSRAGRRRPMISISRPLPPGPSGVDSSVGT